MTLASLGGPTLGDTQIMIRPCYQGDLNFDGVVDTNDVNMEISFGYFGASSAPDGWINNDINYDGVVNVDDINLIISAGTFGLTPAYI